MKKWLENKLKHIEDRYMLLDDSLLMDADNDSTYELEYEYLRGQRDVTLELLEFIKTIK